MRTVWFHREYDRLSGGHLKHSHYFGHVAAMPGFTPRITFTGEPASERLARERQDLWPQGEAGAAVRWRPGSDDLFFVAGVDWRYLLAGGFDSLSNPTVNLIQGVRHAHAGTELYRYLAYKAVRICVSQEVADAINATGCVNGPVLAIANGIDVEPASPGLGARDTKRLPLVIVGYKRPRLAQALVGHLASAEIEPLAVMRFRRRNEFLDLLAESRVAVCLPFAEEGFYLPALEAMAKGCLVVTLDCTGNRGFCRHGENCLVAEPTATSLATATVRALQLPAEDRKELLERAAATVREYTMDEERKRFHAMLADIDRIWASG